MAKIIPLNANVNTDDEFIPLEKARFYICGRHGDIIKRKSLLQKIYRNEFPSGTVVKTMHGNWLFSKNYLTGRMSLNDCKTNNAA